MPVQVNAEDIFRTFVEVRATYSMDANFTGWSWAMARGGGVTDDELDRGEHRGQEERDGEAGVVVAVAPAAQDARRVHPAPVNPTTM
jgi:hypothetical protein